MKILNLKTCVCGGLMLLTGGAAQANIFDSLFGGSANRCEPLTAECLTDELAAAIHNHYPAAELAERGRELTGLISELYRVAQPNGRDAIRQRFADYLVAVPDAATMLDRIDRAGTIGAEDMLVLFDEQLALGAETADTEFAWLIDELVRQGRTEVPARLFRERLEPLLNLANASQAALDWAARYDLEAFKAFHLQFTLQAADWQVVANAAYDLCLSGRTQIGKDLFGELHTAHGYDAPERTSKSSLWARTLHVQGACRSWSAAASEIHAIEVMVEREVSETIAARGLSEGDQPRLAGMSWQLKWSDSLVFFAEDLIHNGEEVKAFEIFARADPKRAVLTYDTAQGDDAFGNHIEDIGWQDFKQSRGLDRPPVRLPNGTLPNDPRLAIMLGGTDTRFVAQLLRRQAMFSLAHGETDGDFIDEMLMALPLVAEDRFAAGFAQSARLALVALQHRNIGCSVPSEVLAGWEDAGRRMEFLSGRVYALSSLILLLQALEDQPAEIGAAICNGAVPS